jgi:hypothetical protein
MWWISYDLKIQWLFLITSQINSVCVCVCVF